MKTRHLRSPKGFSLIELMIVVAILGILAAIAIPAYSDYTVRARVSDMLTMTNSVKVAVSEYYSSTGSLPSSNTIAGVPAANSISSNVVNSVTVGANGVITVSSTEAKLGISSATTAQNLVLTPATGSGGLTWACSSATTNGIDNRYLPASCR